SSPVVTWMVLPDGRGDRGVAGDSGVGGGGGGGAASVDSDRANDTLRGVVSPARIVTSRTNVSRCGDRISTRCAPSASWTCRGAVPSEPVHFSPSIRISASGGLTWMDKVP